ncbi:hypothetical protein AB3X91_06780 [Paraburkholderia sp. BR14263]|uniref:hypothetical protein n=1 Tax=unclassified Paraburkholderia TaxID=2615204 RepID=UPI0034CEE383
MKNAQLAWRGERMLFVTVEGDSAHAFLLLADQVEAVEHVECTVDRVGIRGQFAGTGSEAPACHFLACPGD